MKLTMFTNINTNFFKMSKKILFVLAFLISTLSFSQVEDGTLSIRYATMYEFNQNSNEYDFVEENWTNIEFYFSTDYYVISLEGEDPVQVFWNFDVVEDNQATYVLEDNRVFIFDFDTQELHFFWDWNEISEHHKYYIVWGKTTFESDN